MRSQVLPRLPQPRGTVSESVVDFLEGKTNRTHPVQMPTSSKGDIVDEDADSQLALWILNILGVSGYAGVDPDRASSYQLRAAHWHLDRSFELRLRLDEPEDTDRPIADRIDDLLADPGVQSDTGTTAPRSNPDEVRARLVSKAPYLGWEADPHTLALARLEPELQREIAEIQAGEYGVGHRSTHAQIYRSCLQALGLEVMDAVDRAPAAALAFANSAWLFAREWRLRGAALGQLCLLELDSVAPCRQAISAWDQASLPEDARRWYDVHALADVEHETVIRDRVFPVVDARLPWLRRDMHFGAATTLRLQRQVESAIEQPLATASA